MTMKKWGWVLLGLFFVVLFLFSREGFQDTQKIKGPPYTEEDYTTIVSMMDANWIMTEYGGDATTPSSRARIAQNVAPILSQFHADVYQPVSQTLKESDVDKFLEANTSLYNAKHKQFVKSLLVKYFIEQPHGDANLAQTAAQVASANHAQSSGYSDILRELEQGAAAAAGASGPSGPTGPASGAAGASGASGASGPPRPANSSSSAWRSANTAGGGGNQKVWGPRFNGLGMGSGFGGPDDTRGYPTLLGPTPKPSTMVEGAGIVRDPRGHGSGSGSGSGGPDSNTPSSSSLGSDPDNQYLPYSRTPGDKDLIPDPYRNPSNFSTSGESTKTEPIPFLTDFSAFMK
jgi:hypothetical protein